MPSWLASTTQYPLLSICARSAHKPVHTGHTPHAVLPHAWTYSAQQIRHCSSSPAVL